MPLLIPHPPRSGRPRRPHNQQFRSRRFWHKPKPRPRRKYKRKLSNPKVLNIKRQVIADLDLSDMSGLPNTFISGYVDSNSRVNIIAACALSQLPNYTEFTNLYQQYRIMAMNVQLVPRSSSTYTAPNNLLNLLAFQKQNHTGRATDTALTEANWGEIQLKRSWVVGPSNKMISFYNKLKQADQIFGTSVVNPDYTVQYPQFISTEEPNTLHYGGTISLGTVQGDSLQIYTSGEYKYKIIVTYYLQLRYVK